MTTLTDFLGKLCFNEVSGAYIARFYGGGWLNGANGNGFIMPNLRSS